MSNYRRFCPLCGNRLNPKIHMSDFGKTSAEMVEKQKEILIDVIKGLYISQPEHEFWGLSIIEELQKNEKEIAGKEEG